MADINSAIAAIDAKRNEVPAERSVLVGVTGIDGCGKGYLAAQIAALLERQGLRVAAINADGWLNLPQKRFHPDRPAEHFYEHALRLDEMFEQLILPLQRNRTREVVADIAEETATEYRRHTYQFEDIDIIVLEGIYLLKRAYRSTFDLALWVDCSFETALERALQRGQEGLSLAETIRAYQTIYFPAQRIHFARDNPRSAADLIVPNDARLEGVAVGSQLNHCAGRVVGCHE
jgi:uridine kinase